MLLMLLPLPAVIIFFCVIMRSTKEFPKNFAQFRSEAIYQWLGILGVGDDILSRKRNRVGKLHLIVT